MMRLNVLSVITLPLLVLTLASCSTKTLHDEVAEHFYTTQEYYYLSPSNRALSSTILFQDCSQGAQQIDELINAKGYPDALSVRTLEPLSLSLAYKKSRQSYLCTQGDAGWIITGPEKLSKKVILPPLAIGDTLILASTPAKENSIPTPTEKKSTDTKKVLPQDKPSPTPRLTPAELSHIKALVASLGKDPAALLPSGDIAHTVNDSSETLTSIALWYTFDPSTAKAIGRINHLKSGAPLEKGTIITIPSYLIHNNLKYNQEFQKSFGDKSH